MFRALRRVAVRSSRSTRAAADALNWSSVEERDMSVRRLVRADWQPYCERISRVIASGQRAELEVVSLGSGDHVEARWAPIVGMVYEPKGDLLEVALESVDQLVLHPQEILIESSDRGIVGIEIVTD